MENHLAGSPAGQSVPQTEPLTKELFMKHFNLFPKGNPESTYNLLKYHITNGKGFNGGKVTHDLVFKKWGEYLEMCSKETRKEIYIKSMEKFIEQKDYNMNFAPKLGSAGFLDKYNV